MSTDITSLHLHDVYRRGFRDGWERPDTLVVPADLPAVDVNAAAAAELRRMAESFESIAKGSHGWVIRADAASLRARADELDPPK